MQKYNDSDWLWTYVIINNIKRYITLEEIDLIEKRYSYNDTTWKFERWQEAIELEKQNLLANFRIIEKQATSKRAEYITAEMLPEWVFRELKLAKLKAEWDEIKAEYEKAMFELVSKYWNWIW